VTVHIVGAGLAGLAAAVHMTGRGERLALYEAAGHAGGRCRSFYDQRLERVIDNGTHLILGANPSLFAYLGRIGGKLAESAPAAFPFTDLASGEAWTVRPNAGPLPWWIFLKSRRVLGTGPLDYLAGRKLLSAHPSLTVSQAVGVGPLTERLWRPLSEAVLNTSPEEGQARLLGEVVARTLLKGEAASRPYLAPDGLSAALVDPALAYLERNGVAVHLRARLNAIEANRLVLEGGDVALERGDRVILALPAWSAADLLPELPRLPSRAIVNVHFRLPAPLIALPGGRPFLGAMGGLSQWLSLRHDVLSVTVSAADRLADWPALEIATKIWAECTALLKCPASLPEFWRVHKEKRATLAHTPETERQRPGPRTVHPGLFLAGDWTATGLPCTLEGAIQSGVTAARLAAPASHSRG
jgi:squalene-associated FAD-dependent desaturase